MSAEEQERRIRDLLNSDSGIYAGNVRDNLIRLGYDPDVVDRCLNPPTSSSEGGQTPTGNTGNENPSQNGSTGETPPTKPKPPSGPDDPNATQQGPNGETPPTKPKPPSGPDDPNATQHI